MEVQVTILTEATQILGQGTCFVKSCRYALAGVCRFSPTDLTQIWCQAKVFTEKDYAHIDHCEWFECKPNTFQKAYGGKGSKLIASLLVPNLPMNPVEDLVRNTFRNKNDGRYFDKQLRRTAHFEDSSQGPRKDSFQRLVLSSDKITVCDKDKDTREVVVILGEKDKVKSTICFKDTKKRIPLLEQDLTFCVELVLSQGSEIFLRQCRLPYRKHRGRAKGSKEASRHGCVCSSNPFSALAEMETDDQQLSQEIAEETQTICLQSGSKVPTEDAIVSLRNRLVKQRNALEHQVHRVQEMKTTEEVATKKYKIDLETIDSPPTSATEAEFSKDFLKQLKICHEKMFELGDTGAKGNARVELPTTTKPPIYPGLLGRVRISSIS